MKVFVDETAWIQLIDSEATFHQEVKEVFSSALDKGDQLFTHNVAVGNALNDIHNTLGVNLSGKFSEAIEQAHTGAHLSILWINRRIQKEAIRLMRKHSQLSLNLYDYAAYLLIQRRRIRTILTVKEEYQKLGIQTIPKLKD